MSRTARTGLAARSHPGPVECGGAELRLPRRLHLDPVKASKPSAIDASAVSVMAIGEVLVRN
ncbi:MAG: hypothetical protein ABI645_16600 [Pseudomonadota bacterium]